MGSARGRGGAVRAGPRAGGEACYRGLLGLYDGVAGRGHPAPIAALAEAMNVSKDTVKTRLRTARQRLR
ncbi:hypothetical protein [Paractinoplanes durhamensis]|uniref:Uncharacterized protein n=1 Tax=Paractinoplanes durhamensis TaxID=113563 RepID=A0ABQ3Z6P5_9ACTN|nr:hypothetical protein [Actinoplanes durhamensis]GIE05517.1 hypothetical protein Adu01nite_68670 [Actinoplanes durhamensis]